MSGSIRALFRRYAGVLLSLILLLAPVTAVFSQIARVGASAPRLRTPDWAAAGVEVAQPVLAARSAILVDAGSRTVLAAKNPHLVIPPASLTKIVAIHAALEAVTAGEVALDERFAPPMASWASQQPPRSSLMFLDEGQELTLRELLLGVAVSSGNDAAVALALVVDGSVARFAERMNRSVRELGLVDLFFAEPSGLSEANTITAFDFARFIVAHIERYPELLRDLYSVPAFSYPLPENWLGTPGFPPITQMNRNLLLAERPDVDGLKTGFIEASGYNLAVTAERGGRRLVAVILGIDAPDHTTGGRLRADDGAALLDYGFSEFEQLSFGLPSPEPVRVYGGTQPEVLPGTAGRILVSVPAGSLADLEGRLRQETRVIAPFPDAMVGSASVLLGPEVLAAEPIIIPAQEQGGFFRRAIDAVARFFSELFGAPAAVDGQSLSPPPSTRDR